jgi:hypothetical protein
MVQYFPILGFGPVLGLGFKILKTKMKKGLDLFYMGSQFSKFFGGVGVGHVFSCREVCSHEGGGTLEGVPKP